MASNRVINFQLVDEEHRAILGAGGMAQVCVAGSPDKVSLFDINQVAAANPIALTRGQLYCQVAKSVTTVDIYLASPTGHFAVVKGVTPGDRQSLQINTKDLESTWVAPFSIADSVAGTEKDTGFDFPTGSQVQPIGLSVEVTAADATEDIIAGILSSEASGDADGFILNASTATLGSVRVTATNGADTLGALLKTQDSANAGDDFPAPHVVLSTSRSLSYTLSAGSDTAKGFMSFAVRLALVSGVQSL